MIRTHGLTHISLAVRDPERSLAFYQAVFGVEEYYRDETNIQAKGNGTHDIFAFERDTKNASRDDGVRHFGFRLVVGGVALPAYHSMNQLEWTRIVHLRNSGSLPPTRVIVVKQGPLPTDLQGDPHWRAPSIRVNRRFAVQEKVFQHFHPLRHENVPHCGRD